MNHVMVDIECLGTDQNVPILSIGAVRFDPIKGFNNELWAPFYQRVALTSPNNGIIDPSTLQWWLEQDKAVREETFGGDTALEHVLMRFTMWLRNAPVKGFWSNGPMFDERILRETYARFCWEFPVHFRASRDVRTMIQVAEALGLEKPKRNDTVGKHNALDDAMYQAEGVVQVFQQIYGVTHYMGWEIGHSELSDPDHLPKDVE